MDRRSFLKGTLAGAGLLAMPGLTPTLRAAEATPAAQLNLCSQESRLPGKPLKEIVELLKKWGATGIEFGGNPKDRIADIKSTLKGTGIGVSALCWGADSGKLVSTDPEIRKQGIADLKSALDTAGELECWGGVIFVPCFNKDSQLKADELDKIMFDILPELGDYAKKAGSRVLLEPLNKKEAYYINRIEQAVRICEKVNNEGICTMGDFYHMSHEETDQEKAFITGGKWLKHVHLGTGKSRIMPGQEEHDHLPGMRGLKKMGYRGYCSLECKCLKGTKPEDVIPAAFEYLRKEWEKA